MEDFEELKKKATNYYAQNNVQERLEEILNKMFYEDPKDIYGRLVSSIVKGILLLYILTS